MFKRLSEELDLCAAAAVPVEFWWRDDDAQSASVELDRILQLSVQYAVPLSLATIPHGLDVSLCDRVHGLDQVSILQHGYSHQNFAPATQRKMELGADRPQTEIITQISRGYATLQAQFAAQFVPVMVPPWNRIDTQLVSCLAMTGLQALSTLGPRSRLEPSPGLRQLNVHVDIIDWKSGRCFVGESACIDQIIAHLSAKREGRADAGEATGIMSHHLVHDQGCQDFLAALFEYLNQREDVQLPGVRYCLEQEAVLS